MSLIPPTNEVTAAEKAVLGYVMRSGLTDITLTADDFYGQAHKMIFLAAQKIDGKATPALLADAMYEAGKIQDIGGYEFLVDLWDNAPVSVASYAQVVRDAALRRLYFEIGGRLQKVASAGMPVNDIIERFDQMVGEAIGAGVSRSKLTTMPPAINEVIDMLDQRSRSREEIELPYGWFDLDAITGGLQRGELVVVGARPSIGKTMFAMNIAMNLGARQKRVFYASIEQSAASMAERMLCRQTRISSLLFRSGKIPSEQKDLVLSASDMLREWPIVFDDAGMQSASRIASQAQRAAIKGSLDLVVVDYLNLVEPDNRREQRYLQIGTICQRLKALAKKIEAPLMLLSQLSRDADDKRPSLKDLRESGDIEQHADCVLLLHRPDEPAPEAKTQTIEVRLQKQRNGPIGDIKLVHHKRYYALENSLPL